MTAGPRRPAQAHAWAIIPASSSVDVSEFSAELAQVLRGYGSVLHLSAAKVDRELGRAGIANVASDDPAHLRLSPWLIEQESSHRFVLYEGEARASNWTRRAIRHADHVLVVVDGQKSAALGDVEAELQSMMIAEHAPRRSLVLLQREKSKGYPGTAAFLERRPVHSHFHVRRKQRADVARLVRMLTGNAVCLVLGGGGSRGYAHVGVIRAFEELGIPIDAVGGTSIGAVIAGAAALGLSSQEMLETCAPILARFLDPTLPIVSLMSGERALKGVTAVAGDLDIEDLPIPFFCISTNLCRGGEVVHRTGSAALATRASGAVPGIFPPVPWGNDLLVDGGLANNVPVDTMAALFRGVIIAVDVMPDMDLTSSSGELPNYLSGWKYAWHYVNPFKQRIGMPNILSILMRSVTTASYSLRRAAEAKDLSALYLRPPVQRWNMLDFNEAAPIADQGYRATFPLIRKWWAESGPKVMGEQAAITSAISP